MVSQVVAMKIALLVLLGLFLGLLGGAALGVGAGLAWVEIFKTSNFEGYSGMLVFFGFMPRGAIFGGLAGAVTFGRAGRAGTPKSPSNGRQNRSEAVMFREYPQHLCNAKTPLFFRNHRLLQRPIVE